MNSYRLRRTRSASSFPVFIVKTLCLLAALFVGLLAVGGSVRADTVTPHVTAVSGPVPVVNATDVVCHIMPIQPPAGGPAVAVTYPDCDPRSKLAPAPAPVSPQSPTCNGGCGVLNDHGGPVVTSTQHYFTFLNCTGGAGNCFSNVGAPYGFLSDFFNSNFVHVLDQYMRSFTKQGGSGRYATSPSGCMWSVGAPAVMHDSDLQGYIMGCINFLFPNGGAGGYHQMFSMFLPQGQDLCFNGGGQGNCYCPDNNSGCNGGQWSNGGGFCAYHGSFNGTDIKGNTIHVIYQAQPYADVSTANGGCVFNGPNSALVDSTNNIFSHEMSETITDPDLNAWWRTSDGQEIGDLCQWTGTYANPVYLRAHTYGMQQEYSNKALNCVGAYSTTALTHDFNFDMNSDILWRDTSGDVGLWLMNGTTILQISGVANVPTVWSIVGQRDFNGDGKTDILWRDTAGDVGMWLMNSTSILTSGGVANVPTVWSIAGTGDFNGDGKGDILWHDTSGNVGIWLMNGTSISVSTGVANVPPSVWSIAGVGDFNGDGKADILWIDTSNDVGIWFMNGTSISQSVGVARAPPGWSIVGTGDFNGDGYADILWRDTAGDVGIWLMQGTTILSAQGVANVPTAWAITQTGDYNSDGKSDILWHDTSGNVGVWFMNGATISSTNGIANVPTVWSIQGAAAD